MLWWNALDKCIATLLTLTILAAASRAAPMRKKDHRKETITKFKIDPWQPDRYHFEYETSFGSSRTETGRLKKTSDGRRVLVTVGHYSYVNPDGSIYRVDYRADENGYHQSRAKKMHEQLETTTSAHKVEDGDEEQLLEDIFSSSEEPAVKEVEVVKGKSDIVLDNRLPRAVVASLLG